MSRPCRQPSSRSNQHELRGESDRALWRVPSPLRIFTAAASASAKLMGLTSQLRGLIPTPALLLREVFVFPDIPAPDLGVSTSQVGGPRGAT